MTKEDVARLRRAALRVHNLELEAWRASAAVSRAQIQKMKIHRKISGDPSPESEAALVQSLESYAAQCDRFIADAIAGWPELEQHFERLRLWCLA